MKDYRTTNRDTVRRLPRLGKLALGIKVAAAKGKSAYPSEVDYFVLREDAGCSAELRAKFVKIYGERPKMLDIVLPSEDVPDFFPSAYKCYGSGTGIRCTGDGETARRIGKMMVPPRTGDEAGEFFDIDCPGEDCEFYVRHECKCVSTLTFMLPRVSVAGYFQIDTSSWYSRNNLLSDIDMVQAIFGRISGLISQKNPYPTALLLTREAQPIQYDGKKKIHHTMHIRIRNSEQLDIIRLQNIRLARAGALMIEHHNDKPEDLYPQAELPPPPAAPSHRDPTDDPRDDDPIIPPDAAAEDAPPDPALPDLSILPDRTATPGAERMKCSGCGSVRLVANEGKQTKTCTECGVISNFTEDGEAE